MRFDLEGRKERKSDDKKPKARRKTEVGVDRVYVETGGRKGSYGNVFFTPTYKSKKEYSGEYNCMIKTTWHDGGVAPLVRHVD